MSWDDYLRGMRLELCSFLEKTICVRLVIFEISCF